jgi:hypothetical protein
MLPPEFSYILGIAGLGQRPAGSPRFAHWPPPIWRPSFLRELKSLAGGEDAVVKTPEKCALLQARDVIGVDGAI